jgi:hypothetical protein
MSEPTRPPIATAATIRRLWAVLIVVLVLTLAAEPLVPHHGEGLRDSFGFGAWYGFLSCVVLVLFSRALGLVLKRKDGFYDAEVDAGLDAGPGVKRGGEP